MIASLSPKTRKFKTMIVVLVKKIPTAFFMPKYFSKINGGIVTPPLDAPIQYRVNIPKLKKKLPRIKEAG